MIEIPENYLTEINDIAKRRIDEEVSLIARMKADGINVSVDSIRLRIGAEYGYVYPQRKPNEICAYNVFQEIEKEKRIAEQGNVTFYKQVNFDKFINLI
jgi:hypothetical protein